MWVKRLVVGLLLAAAVGIGGSPNADCVGDVIAQDSTDVETPDGLLRVDVCVTRDSETGTDTYTYTVTNVSHTACNISSFGLVSVADVDAKPIPFGRWTSESDGFWWIWDTGQVWGIKASSQPVDFVLQAATATETGEITGGAFTGLGTACGQHDYRFTTIGPVGVLLRDERDGTVDASDVAVEAAGSARAEGTLYSCEEPSRATFSLEPETGLNWVRLGGPPGGIGYDIRMDPRNPDRMYVTDASGGGLHISKDAGHTWVPSNEGIRVRTGPSGDVIPVFSVTIDPHNPDILWAGTQSLRGIYRSSDGGETWVEKVSGVVETVGISFRGFTVDPRGSDIVYAAAEISSYAWTPDRGPRTGRQFDLTRGVVYKTTDGGDHWSAIWRGDNLARYVWIDPRDPDVIYVSTGFFDREAANSDPLTGNPGGVGIVKSADGGRTWRTLDKRNGLENLYVSSLFMHPENPDILLAAAGNNTYPEGSGAYLSTNGGDSWRRVLATQYREACGSVEYATGNPDVAYAGSEHGFYHSSDGGQTWTKTNTGMAWGPPGVYAGQPIDLQVDPRDVDRVFANNYQGGNFLSEDAGQTWVDSSSGYTGAQVYDVAVRPGDPTAVYANGFTRPFLSIDGGLTWRGINIVPDEPIAVGARVEVDPSDPCHVLMSSNEGRFFESLDGGLSWSLILDVKRRLSALGARDANEQFQGVQAIAFAPCAPDRVYAGFGQFRCATGQQLWRCDAAPVVSLLISDDGGRTWEQKTGTALDGSTITGIVVHPEDKDHAWAATAAAGVFATTDGGETWTATSSGLRNRNVLAIALDLRSPSTLYVGTAAGGLYKSTDSGRSWQASSAGMDPNERINSVVVDHTRSDVVFAGSAMSGVFVSFDGGSSWRRISSGLRMRSVNDLALSGDGGFLYAATEGEGIFRLNLADVDSIPAGTSPASGDRDGDGVPDNLDYCPDFPGSAEMNGC